MTRYLKPCPFCGEKPLSVDISKLRSGCWTVIHFCYKYDKENFDRVTTLYAPSKKELIEHWNRGANND